MPLNLQVYKTKIVVKLLQQAFDKLRNNGSILISNMMLVVYVMYVTLQNQIDKMYKMTNDLSETFIMVCYYVLIK